MQQSLDISWKTIESYFSSNKYFVSKHHLDSYNDFITKSIPLVVKSMNPFPIRKYFENQTNVLKHLIEIYIGGENSDELFYNKPVLYEDHHARLLYPNEARLKDMSYACELRANIVIKYTTRSENNTEKIETKRLENVLIGYIPIMLHSKLCMLANQPPSVLREMGECPYDQGGYFIVDGKEKVIIAQERNVTNKLFINKSKEDKYNFSAFIRCTSEKNSVFPKTIFFYVLSDQVARIKDEKDVKVAKRKDAILVRIPQINKEIPLFILFRALGIESDKMILEYILGGDLTIPENAKLLDFLSASVIDSNYIFTQEQALAYISNHVEFKSIDNVRYILVEHLFPNIPTTFNDKAVFLGSIVLQIAKTCVGIILESDRDNYMNKRVGISGFLLADVFKDFYNVFRVNVRSMVDKEYEFGGGKNLGDDISNMITNVNKKKIFYAPKMVNGLLKSLKGTWGVTNDSSKEGIVQDLSRISYVGFTSHLRPVNTPMDTSVKIREPHRLNGSQWGIMCPCESPDGASIGLLKNFAILCHITFHVESELMLKALRNHEIILLKDLTIKNANNLTKLYINNNWIGVVYDPPSLVKYVKLLRRTGCINPFVSISWNVLGGEIQIFTDSGRCCRPLFIVEDNKILARDRHEHDFDWKKMIIGDLFEDIPQTEFRDPFTISKSESVLDVMKFLEQHQGVIEFIDVEESNTCVIGMKEDQLKNKLIKYTHCEIHPSTIFSAYTSSIPLSNHNQAPRNIFSGAQGKQAIGVYATNFNNRIDTMSYVLHYPQKPLVSTRYMDYLNNNKLPNGENVIVAIATYSGYNQEDSIIINKSSMERGMFNLTYYKSYISTESTSIDSNKNVERIFFANPNTLLSEGTNVEIKKFADYTSLDENGMPKENVFIKENVAIIGKCMQQTEYSLVGNANDVFKNEVKKQKYVSKTEVADKTMSGFVDKVVLYKNNDNEQTAKIRLRKPRYPELGDKLASRHGQKGVIGMIMPQDMMPFTKDGLVPDIIINPHAFPTRMTIAHLIECVLSKVGVYEGFTCDGTAFEPYDFESLYDLLEKKHGLDRHGDEIMYNGITGEQMETKVFIGPTYYFRLKHMVADKINYRLDGKVVNMTKQPTKGRGNNGGLRIGEMETNAIVSHGLSSFEKESMMERSDKHKVYVSKNTGYIVPVNDRKGIRPSDEGVTTVQMPYAFKLFIQELQTMSIHPRLIMDDMEQEMDEDLDENDLYLSEKEDEENNEPVKETSQ